MERIYLAYGSNLNKQQMRYRCPGAKVAGTAVIEGYELLFKGSGSGAYLTIEPKEGSRVEVAAWYVTPEDEARLDRYEGFPHFYYKKAFKVDLVREGMRKRKVDAFAYIMHEDRPFGIPSNVYVRTCLDGYVDFGIPCLPLLAAVRRSADLAEQKHT